MTLEVPRRAKRRGMFKIMSVSNHVRVFLNTDSFKGYFSKMIIEAHLELIKDARTSKNVEPYTKAFRKPYWGNYFVATDLQREVMEIGGNITPIANYDHLPTPLVPLDADTLSVIYTQDAESRSRINKCPQLVTPTKSE